MRTRTFMRSVSCTAVIVSLVFCGCKHLREQNKFPSGSLVSETIRFQYAVYIPPKALQDPAIVLRRALAKDFTSLKLVEDLPESASEMLVRARLETNVPQKYAVPSIDSLRYSGRGLTSQQIRELQAWKKAYILDFAHPKQKVWEALRSADRIIEEIARETNGLVWDETTREVFTPDAWHTSRLAPWSSAVPDISTHVAIDTYNNGEFDRAISLGMTKFGLPDAVVQELDSSSTRSVGNLINVFLQALAEGATARSSGRFRIEIASLKNAEAREPHLKSLKPNAIGAACTTLKIAQPEEGDPDNRIVQLTFDDYRGNDSHARQQAALHALFGWKDSVQSVEHTEELLAESQKEKANLPRLRTTFNKGLEPNEYILVKAPFDVPDGGREWMWVEVRRWDGRNIEGLLENEPANVLNLHGGQLVKVREEDIFDYVHKFPDGYTEGNTTGELLDKAKTTQSQSENKASPVFIPSCSD